MTTPTPTNYDAILEAQDAWLRDHYAEHPPIRLATPEDHAPIWVDAVFAGAASIRGIWQPVIKRGRGRPRKTPAS